MRALLTALVGFTTIGLSLVAVAPSARSDTECQVTDPQTGKCLVWVDVPTPGGGDEPVGGDLPDDTGSGASCYWDPKKQGVAGPPAGPVPCTSSTGYWSNTYNCYVQLAKPQPPAGDPAWQGHEPGEGAVYQCYQPQTGILVWFWAQDAPPGAGTGPSPREVALLAIDSMQLEAIDIGIAPEPGPDSVGIVGMPVWMWADDPDQQTFGPSTASASAGGITITATARVEQVTWTMGDGTSVVCRTAGTPYEPRFGGQQSPDCGHSYALSSAHNQGGTYTVTATSDWVVTWSGAGQTGTIRLDGLVRSVEIAVGEAQVLGG
ncbi:hypothetical protein FXB39_07940 [Nocardioides sp. BGMRC 2183]|nr:hypothetical protein FXB39_07940 [Nocardioides sp. BGMRC 2183]